MKKIREEIAKASEVILSGGIVCFPTESTYGLAALASNHEALERLAEVKGRNETSPFGLIVPSIASAKELVENWSPKAQMLADMHWPGPLTMVMKAKSGVHSRLLGDGAGIGFRITSHKIAQQLVESVGSPITATSANLSGQSNAQSIGEAKGQLGADVDYYLDGGECGDQPSTVVFVNQEDIKVLRPGPIDL